MTGRIACVLTLLSIGAAMSRSAIASEGPLPPDAVFTSIGAPEPATSGFGIAWPVTVNLDLLASDPESIVLNFPNRTWVTVTRFRFEDRGPGMFLWTGGGNCVTVFSAAPTSLFAVFSCLNANYAIDTIEDGGRTLLTCSCELAQTSPRPAPTLSTLTLLVLTGLILLFGARKAHHGGATSNGTSRSPTE
jgi:hypothetical protein